MGIGNGPLKVEHIGIAVRDLKTAIERYESILSTRCYAVEEVPDELVRTAFFKVGDTKIELLESTTPDGPIARFIERRGEGVHHLALSVSGLQATLDELSSRGVEVIDPVPRPGAEGLRIAFVHPRTTRGVLLEFCELPGGPDHSPERG